MAIGLDTLLLNLNRLSAPGGISISSVGPPARLERPLGAPRRKPCEGAFSFMTDNNEIMKPCPSWPGYYADQEGRVFSDKPIRMSKQPGQLHELKPSIDLNGYPSCCLSIKNFHKSIRVHTMVLDAFVGPRPVEKECRHLDGNRQNNRLENIRWGTMTDNQRDRARHGTVTRMCGEKNGFAKLTWPLVAQIRNEYRKNVRGFTTPALAKKFHVSYSAIWYVIKRKTWRENREL